MIYFDNAATCGFPVPSAVDAAVYTLKYLHANPGRSSHRQSRRAAEIVYEAREALSDLFSLNAPENVIFTKNCTEALNLAIFGTVKAHGRVLTTVFEHNSVLRPLAHLQAQNHVAVDYLLPEPPLSAPSESIPTPQKATEKRPGATPQETFRFLPAIRRAVETDRTPVSLIVMTGASNVTGALTDYEAVSAFASQRGIPFLLDAAQIAGHVPVSMQNSGVTLCALPGHKGLGGVQGSGALLVQKGADVGPLLFGGTGTETFSASQPAYYPERLESGTLNLPAIAALKEAALYAKSSVSRAGKLLYDRTAYLVAALKERGITVYSAPNPCGIVAFNVPGQSSEDVATVFSDRFDIAVRAGYHCAPKMHEFLKTESIGAVRVSLSPQNSPTELRAFLYAVSALTPTP